MVARRLAALATAVLLAMTLPVGTAAAAPAPPFTIPVDIGNASQIITVTATSHSATVGKLRAWQKGPKGRWRKAFGPMKAYLGSAGIGQASEYVSRTPQGTFTLTQAFGARKNPGTAMPYRKSKPNDWWVSDVAAPTYNTLQNCAPTRCEFTTAVSERLKYIRPYYDFAVVLDVNRSPVVKGAGSAFFLHVSVGQPTEGCIAVGKKKMKKILRWLDPAASPRIAIEVR